MHLVRHRGLKVALVLATLAVLLPLSPGAASAVAGDISTVVGNGTQASTGDGGPATAASINNPAGVALDSAGNVYVSEFSGNRVRKVDGVTGVITTMAGDGVFGFSGDNGPATSARLGSPPAITLDRAGNLYIADEFNNRVRKVDAVTGIITTVAGSGPAGSPGTYDGDNGPATSARLNLPNGVAVDAANNLYISDRDNQRVRKVDATGIITTVAGNGFYGFTGDNGPATSAELRTPYQLAVDEVSNLYISDSENHRIRKVDRTGTIATVAGNGANGFSGDGGPATSAAITSPSGVLVDTTGNLYISDRDNHRVRKVDPAGIITTVAGTGVAGFSGDSGPATGAQLNSPQAIAIDRADNFYVADFWTNRVRKIASPQQFTVTLDQPSQSRSVGQTAALTAHVTNLTGTSVGGVTVNFSRTGANTAPTQSVVTNPSGNASYSYVGTKQGVDTIGVTTAGSPTGSAVATVAWGAPPGYPSGDCAGLGTNVFDGFFDGGYLRLRTAPNPFTPNETWVCVALDNATAHFGGKVRVSGNTLSVVSVDDNQGQCDANPSSRVLNQPGTVGSVSFDVDVNAMPGSDLAWVCVRVSSLPLAKRIVIRTDSPSGTGFDQDVTTPFPYVERPNPGSASSTCQAAPIGRTRLLNADVGTAHIWLDTLSQNGGIRASVCVRGQHPSVNPTTAAGAALTADSGGGQTFATIDSVFDFTPCDTNVLTLGTPPLQLKAHAGAPAWACVQVGGIVRRVRLDAGGQSVASLTQDS